MKLKHTPGPWKAAVDTRENIVVAPPNMKEGDYGPMICLVSNKQDVIESDFANARLIAAAPDMLDTIISALTPSTKDGWLWNKFAPIIEKATGMTIDEVLEAMK